METGFLAAPIFVSPSFAWRANRLKFHKPDSGFLVSPKAVYILLGTRTTRCDGNWIQFDFVMLDHNCELVGIPWGSYKDSPTKTQYDSFLRSFAEIG